MAETLTSATVGVMAALRSSSTLFARRTCFIFGVLVIVGFASLLILEISAHAQRDRIERADAIPTAVKDTAFFTLPTTIDLRRPIIHWRGNPYFATDDAPEEEGDGVMLKVGTTAEGGVIVYRKARKESEAENEEAAVHIKVGPGEFLALRPQPKATPP